MPNGVIEMSQGAFNALAQKAADGERYRKFLRAELKRLGKLVGDEKVVAFAVDTVEDAAKLEKMRKELQSKWDKLLPPRSQLRMSAGAPEGVPAVIDPDRKRIYEGLGVTPEMVEKYQDK